ncbi:MAG: DNA internalization-related competence protein ComEC/Rec2 [Nitrospiraceae bacterium]|nr:DNA internalization-related competence protein ComEC/Rec2 [Nitrospiraceae bacterium]
MPDQYTVASSVEDVSSSGGLSVRVWRLPFNRPLVWVAVIFVAGTVAGARGICPGVLFPLFIGSAGVIIACVAPSLTSARMASVSLAVFAAGALLWNVRHDALPGDGISSTVAGYGDAVRGTVEGTVRLSQLEFADPQLASFLIDADRLEVGEEAQTLRGGVQVYWTDPGFAAYAGDRIRVTGDLTVALGHVNPGVDGREDRLRRMGIHTRVTARAPDAVTRVAAGSWWSPRYWASRLRYAQLVGLRKALPESVQPFVFTVWLGYRRGAGGEASLPYLLSGTGHILAVSGVHMAIVFVTVSYILRVVVRKRRVRAVLVIIAVLLFALMAGARASAMRAAIMVIAYMVADLFDRDPDAPTALALSSLILLGWHPDWLFDAGFQLSYLSVASLLLFAGGLYSGLGFLPRYLRGPLSVSTTVQLLPLPVAIHCFHIFPLFAPLTNLVVLPLFTIALGLTFLTTTTALMFPWVAPLFGHALLPVVWLIRGIATAVATPGFTHFTVVSPTALAMFAYWGAIGAWGGAVVAGRRRRWIVAGIVLSLTTLATWRPVDPEGEVVFLDVGHGDSTFVRSPGGRTLLVDAGDSSRYASAGKWVVAPFLWGNHTGRLDYLAITHPDRDHIGGAFYILEWFPVGEVLLSAAVTDRPLERKLLDVCAARGVPVRRLAQGDTLDLGDVQVDVLHPPTDWPATRSVNDGSLVFRLVWEDEAVLLTGDIERDAEAALAAGGCRAGVLKVPHHGSRTSSSPVFIRSVAPLHAIVSTGGATGRERVDAGVLARYEAGSVRVWRTDHLGGVRLTRRDGQTVIRGTRIERHYPYPLSAAPAAHATGS